MIKYSILVCLLISTTGCATIYNPATKRKEYVFINTAQEINIGREVERSILKKYKISQNASYKRRVQKIGQKIADASDRKDLRYKFEVIESNKVNAFALPGGSVFVTTGLLEEMNRDDELASVIGHEVGHISARHPAKRLESQLGYSFLVNLAYALDTRSPKLKDEVWEDITMATNITFRLITLGYSRRDEILADKLGVIYAERAGYDPNGAISFLMKLGKKEKHTPEWLAFLRSHPYVKDRITALKEWMSERPTGD